jgi:hypothetical protein
MVKPKSDKHGKALPMEAGDLLNRARRYETHLDPEKVGKTSCYDKSVAGIVEPFSEGSRSKVGVRRRGYLVVGSAGIKLVWLEDIWVSL